MWVLQNFSISNACSFQKGTTKINWQNLIVIDKDLHSECARSRSYRLRWVCNPTIHRFLWFGLGWVSTGSLRWWFRLGWDILTGFTDSCVAGRPKKWQPWKCKIWWFVATIYTRSRSSSWVAWGRRFFRDELNRGSTDVEELMMRLGLVNVVELEEDQFELLACRSQEGSETPEIIRWDDYNFQELPHRKVIFPIFFSITID